MNKKRVRIFSIGALVFSLCLPIMITNIQDFNDIDKQISLEDNQTDVILKDHPVIESIYKLRQRTDTTSDEYVIKQKDEYNQEKQEKFQQIKSLFNEEIKKMVQNGIINYELLETQNGDDFVDYGKIRSYESIYYLTQVLRTWQDSFKSFAYDMDPSTHKIIEFCISQEKVITLNDDDMKAMAWGMIKYLELDDIEDWVYNQYGYESNLAKLRISCEFEKFVNTNNVRISINLLGTLVPYIHRETIRQ